MPGNTNSSSLVEGLAIARMGGRAGVVVLTKTPHLFGHLVRELVHFADWRLLNRWVASNKVLAIGNRPVDVLFAKYSTVSRGRVYLDRHFVRTFLEIRAYMAEYQLVTHYFKKNNQGLQKAAKRYHYVSKAMLDLVESGAAKSEVFQYLNLHRENLFDKAIELGAFLENTISRSMHN